MARESERGHPRATWELQSIVIVWVRLMVPSEMVDLKFCRAWMQAAVLDQELAYVRSRLRSDAFSTNSTSGIQSGTTYGSFSQRPGSACGVARPATPCSHVLWSAHICMYVIVQCTLRMFLG